jgi:class 3 adenylate cyclase/tetratricopeptide (TPR) repeat protein/energy-coupling factor transporter ATP-binding protein EcfA2
MGPVGPGPGARMRPYAGRTMNCPTCGAESAAGARFCSACGQPLRPLSEERRVVTVLFADLVGFTSLSETLDPEQVKRLVESAFERLVRDVTAFGGRVDKIVGDAIVALFGAPVAHEDDAERAVRAALRMQETLTGYAEESGVAIRMRIGVNTGEVLVGALRAGGDYTAMGDVVNTASRLQTLASPGEVLVGESTHLATRDVISYEPRGALIARGREQPVNVWTAATALLPPGYRPRLRRSPLVGRESEMAMLLNTVRVSLSHHRAQLVLILGEAGVGKSRLATELAAAVADEERVVDLSGRCVPYGEANPWWPIAEVLRGACGVGRDEPLEAARAKTAASVAAVCDDSGAVGSSPDGAIDRAAVVDGLLHLMGYEGPLRELDGTRVRAEATQSLLTYIEAAVRRGPLMIRLADLHWADPAVLELIDELSPHLARHPVIFVATARRALQERWTPRGGRFNSLVLNLDPLEREATALLLDTLAGTDLAPTTREALLDRSGGNPFYLEELVTLLGQQQVDAALAGATGERSPAALMASEAIGPSTTEGLPDTLRGLVAARIDGLSPEEQMVLEDASVWGSSGPLKAVERISEAVRGAPVVAPVIQSLADKDVLVLDGSEWSFRSDLVREVAYARLTKRDRMLRHAGIAGYLADAVAGRFADDGLVDTVARHYVEAARLAADLGAEAGHMDLADRAVHWSLEAARRAEESASWPLAERLLSHALDLLGRDGDPATRLRCHLGRSLSRAEQWDEAGARSDADAALVLAGSLSDPASRAHALLRLAAADTRAGRRHEAEAGIAEAIELFDGVGDVRGRAEALRQLGMSFLLRGDQRAAEEPIAAALDAFRALGDRRGEAWSMQNLAWIAFNDGRTEHAERFVEASERAFREVGDRGGLAWVQGLAAFVRFRQGDFDAARDLATRILRESERRGDRYGQGMMHLVLGGVELWSGHPRSATTAAEQAVVAFRSAGDANGLEQSLVMRGRAEVMSGHVESGLASFDEAGRAAADLGTGSRLWAHVRAVTEVQLGRPAALLRLDDEQITDVQGLAPSDGAMLAARGLALAQIGEDEAAWEAVQAAVAMAPDGGAERSAAALVAACTGRVADAERAAGTTRALRGATYLDRLTADLALALLDAGAAGEVALETARRELGTGEDAVASALVALAAEVRAESGGGDATGLAAEAASSLARLGLEDTAWRDVFRRIAAVRVA